MFVKPLQLAQRLHEIENHLTALKALYTDHKTLNVSKRSERTAVRALADDLEAEKKSIYKALMNLDAVKVEK